MTNITQTPKASRSEKPKMVYTPEYKIPIGEAITLPDGHLGLRIKKTVPMCTKRYLLITSLAWFSRPQERQRNRPPECEVAVALSTYIPL